MLPSVSASSIRSSSRSADSPSLSLTKIYFDPQDIEPLVLTTFVLRFSGSQWYVALAKNYSAVARVVRAMLANETLLPEEFITINKMFVGSLMVDVTFTRNASYALPDSVIASILGSVNVTALANVYSFLTNATDSISFLSFGQLPATPPTEACGSSCVAIISVSVGLVCLAALACAIAFLCYKRKQRRRKQRRRETEPDLDDVEDAASNEGEDDSSNTEQRGFHYEHDAVVRDREPFPVSPVENAGTGFRILSLPRSKPKRTPSPVQTLSDNEAPHAPFARRRDDSQDRSVSVVTLNCATAATSFPSQPNMVKRRDEPKVLIVPRLSGHAGSQPIRRLDHHQPFGFKKLSSQSQPNNDVYSDVGFVAKRSPSSSAEDDVAVFFEDRREHSGRGHSPLTEIAHRKSVLVEPEKIVVIFSDGDDDDDVGAKNTMTSFHERQPFGRVSPSSPGRGGELDYARHRQLMATLSFGDPQRRSILVPSGTFAVEFSDSRQVSPVTLHDDGPREPFTETQSGHAAGTSTGNYSFGGTPRDHHPF